MENRDSSLDGLYQEFAGRFAALGQFFGQLSSPEAAKGLIESLTTGDPATFKQMTDRVNIPMLGKCFWIREVIESAMCDFAGLVEECRLRENLTAEEEWTYIAIWVLHRPVKKVEKGMAPAADPTVISPGAFLDELKANGLVTCRTRATWDCSIEAVLAPPEKICI